MCHVRRVDGDVALAISQTYGSAGKNGRIDYRSTEGKVAALDLNSKTLQVMPADGPMSGAMHVAIRGQATIHQAILHCTAPNFTAGKDVNLRSPGSANKWVADNISSADSSVVAACYLGYR